MKQAEDMFDERNYVVEGDQLSKLQRIASELQGGTDRERDYGHRLWLILNAVKEQVL